MKKKTKNILGGIVCCLCLVAVVGGVTALLVNTDNPIIDKEEIGINSINGLDKVTLNSAETYLDEKEVKVVEDYYLYKFEVDPGNANKYEFEITSSNQFIKIVDNDKTDFEFQISAYSQFKEPAYINIKDTISKKVKTIEVLWDNYDEEKASIIFIYNFNGIVDDTKTSVLEVNIGETIDPNPYKLEFSGYKFEKVEGITEFVSFQLNENKVVALYYVSDLVTLTVEYYKDDVLDDSLTDIYSYEKEKDIYINSFKKDIYGYKYSSCSMTDNFKIYENTTLKYYYILDESVVDPENPPIDINIRGEVNGEYITNYNGISGNVLGDLTITGYSGIVYLSTSSYCDDYSSLEVTDGQVVEINDTFTSGTSGSSGFAGGNLSSTGGRIYVFNTSKELLGSFVYTMENVTVEVSVTGDIDVDYIVGYNSVSGNVSGNITVIGYTGTIYLSTTSACADYSELSVENGIVETINDTFTSGTSGSSGFAGGNLSTNGGTIYIFNTRKVMIGSITYTANNITPEVTLSGNLAVEYNIQNNTISGNVEGFITVENYTGEIRVSTSNPIEDYSTLNVTAGQKLTIKESFTSGISASSGFAGGYINSSGGTFYFYNTRNVLIGALNYECINMTENIEVTGNLTSTYETASNAVHGVVSGNVTINGYTGTVYVATTSDLGEDYSTLTVSDGVSTTLNESWSSGTTGATGFAGGYINSSGGTFYFFNSSKVLIGSLAYTIS